ncbi:MAG TPA: hypothetical protein VHO73_00900 [Methylomirabilota bacterium]|nr:hypothetical protein [Methylomirabilota bacterium]
MTSAVWHGAFRYVAGALTIGLAEEGTLWSGQHESIGTLRGYGQGVVWNYEQRRVLMATAWALERPDFFVDPERVHIWGQSAGWALRHGDVYAVVMSDGHNNYRTSREGMKHAWKWGPPGGGRNWLGVNHLDYLDLARWVRDNPAIELPFWIGAPAYGTFPSHALGDFGFKPWQEFLSAMMETRRAFAATWMSNGPGDTTGVMQEMVPQIRLHQSLPAFSRGSLDARPLTDEPKGQYHPGKWDQDFQRHADKEGGTNLYLRWHTDSIADEADRWEMTVFLTTKAPADTCTVDITPRRSQKFRATPGERFKWSNTSLAGQRELQSGEVVADASGLVTLEKVVVDKSRNRIRIWR